MSGAFLVIASNGQSYSDHRHAPVAWCATREEAEELVGDLMRWIAARPVDDCGSIDPWSTADKRWRERAPLTLAGDVDEWFESFGTFVECTVLEVPRWAR